MQNLKYSVLSLMGLAALALFCVGCSPKTTTADHLKKAELHFGSGHYDEAEIEYMNVLQREPLNPQAIGRLGQIYFDQGRMGRVIPYLVKGKELQPENLDLRLKLGVIFLSTGNIKGASDEANYILDRKPEDEDAPVLLADSATNPDSIEAVRRRLLSLPPAVVASAPMQVALGSLEFRQKHLTEAEAFFQRALIQNPKSSAAQAALGGLYRAQNDLPRADTAFKQAAALSPRHSSRQLIYAKYKVQSGDLDAGRSALLEITAQAPDYLPALLLLAEVAAAEKKYPESATLVAKVLARDPTHPEAMLLSARLKLALGEKDKAVAEMEKMTKLFPQSPPAQFQLGMAYFASGDLDKATASTKQALTLAPNYAEASFQLAEIYLRKGDMTGATALLKSLVQQRPDITQARVLLADAYRSQGAYTEALTLYSQLEQLLPGNPQPIYGRGLVLLQQSKRDEARRAFQKTLELAPGSVPALDQLISLDLAEKNFAAAHQLVDGLIARGPKEPGSYVLQAKVFVGERDNAKAEASLRKAIELQPDSPTAYLLLARLFASSNQLDKALAGFQDVIVKNPRSIEALLMTSILLDQGGKYAEARDTYEKLLAIDPKFGPALNNLAYLYADKLNQPDKAQALAQRARDLAPNDPSTADTLGWIAYKRRQYPWAVTLLAESAAKLTDSADVQFHLGMAHYMVGNESAARDSLSRALQLEKNFSGSNEAKQCLSVLEIDPKTSGAAGLSVLEKMVVDRPEDPIALAKLAAAYSSAGASAKAIEAYQNALQKSPGNLSAMLGLSRLLAANGQTAKALEIAKGARKLAPDDPEVSHDLGRLAYQTRDYQWAFSLLQEAGRKSSENSAILFDLAEAAYSIGRITDAEDAMRRSLLPAGVSAKADEANRFLKLVGAAVAPDAAAISQAEEVDKANPDYVPALMVLAAAREQKFDLSGARQNYERILKLFPDFVPAQKRLVILSSSETSNIQAAFDLATKVREALPNDPELAKAFGIIAFKKGDFSRAANLLRESGAQRPQDAELFYFLGAAQSKLSQRTESRQSLQRALDLKLRPDLAIEAQRILSEKP